MNGQFGQLELDATAAAFGSILGHLTAGGPRTLQALAINIMTGASVGFFLAPPIVDYFLVAPGRSASGIAFWLAVLGAVILPTLLRGLRPWTEKNTDNIIGRTVGKVVNLLGPVPVETKPAGGKS